MTGLAPAPIEAERLPSERAAELEHLKETWGDYYEHIRVDPDGLWRGRRRHGDPRDLEAMSAAALDSVFRIIYFYEDLRLPMARVAARLGIGPRRVRRTLDSAGIASRWDISSDEADAIAKAVVNGMTRAEAAAKFGITPGRVGRALSKAGKVPAPDRDHLRAAQAAAVAGISVTYLGALARAGRIESIRGTERGYRVYERAVLEAFAASRRARAARSVPSAGSG
jgi:hypothetical protein